MEAKRALRMLRATNRRRQDRANEERKDELSLEVKDADLGAEPPILEATREALVEEAAAARAAIMKEAEDRTARIHQDMAIALARADMELAAKLVELNTPLQKKNPKKDKRSLETRKVHKRAQSHLGIPNAPTTAPTSTNVKKMDLPPRSGDSTGAWVMTIDSSGKERLRPPSKPPKLALAEKKQERSSETRKVHTRAQSHLGIPNVSTRSGRGHLAMTTNPFVRERFSPPKTSKSSRSGKNRTTCERFKCCSTCKTYAAYTVGGLLASPFMILCCPCLVCYSDSVFRCDDGDDDACYLSDMCCRVR